jgi:hypothetical protein
MTQNTEMNCSTVLIGEEKVADLRSNYQISRLFQGIGEKQNKTNPILQSRS